MREVERGLLLAGAPLLLTGRSGTDMVRVVLEVVVVEVCPLLQLLLPVDMESDMLVVRGRSETVCLWFRACCCLLAW